jgi:hypothetical protein
MALLEKLEDKMSGTGGGYFAQALIVHGGDILKHEAAK